MLHKDMPYADPKEQADYQRDRYARLYRDNPEFRVEEALRKRIWYYRNQAAILARYRARYRDVRKKLRVAKRLAFITAKIPELEYQLAQLKEEQSNLAISVPSQ
jgi:phosphoglycolate phosphatase-like HAD superfamily hydrolase